MGACSSLHEQNRERERERERDSVSWNEGIWPTTWIGRERTHTHTHTHSLIVSVPAKAAAVWQLSRCPSYQIHSLAGVHIVDAVMSGFNCCLFAYGQSGAGKTYTLQVWLDSLWLNLTGLVISHAAHMRICYARPNTFHIGVRFNIIIIIIIHHDRERERERERSTLT